MWRHVSFVSILLAVVCLADSNAPENPEAALFAGLDLQPVQSPAEQPVEYTLHRWFSYQRALEGLDWINSALVSFEKLTTLARSILPAEKLADVGHTDPETQFLGFANWPGTVRGTLQKQHYMIAKLQYDLALKQLADHEITEAQAEKARQEYEQAKQAFLAFWNTFCISD